MTDRLPTRSTATPMTGGVPPPRTRLPERVPAPSAVAAPVTLESVVSHVRDLPALPVVVLQVLQMTGRDGSGANELARLIARDPHFTARVLKLANSAHYGLPRAIGTLSEAVMMLGNRTIRNIAVVAATRDTLQGAVSGYALGQGDLWRHSLACGTAAQMLAEAAGYAETEEAFVAGLLHDVGKIILGTYVAEAMPRIGARMESDGCAYVEAERAVLGFDHADVGGRVARQWNLPLALVQAIAWHHQPVQNGRVLPLCALVHLGNLICLMAGVGLGADGLRMEGCGAALEALHLDESHIEATLSRLVSTIAQPGSLFSAELH